MSQNYEKGQEENRLYHNVHLNSIWKNNSFVLFYEYTTASYPCCFKNKHFKASYIFKQSFCFITHLIKSSFFKRGEKEGKRWALRRIFLWIIRTSWSQSSNRSLEAIQTKEKHCQAIFSFFFRFSIEFHWECVGCEFKCSERGVTSINIKTNMTQQQSDFEFLDLLKRASSKDYQEEEINESTDDNPETNFDLDLPSGIWRTNLFL